MSDSGYNTNLAAEYYVLSMLYRKGYNAYLTLGNKKSIDIIIDHGKRTSTIDVKGMVSKTSWPMDNFDKAKKNHYIALVTYLNKIGDHTLVPETYIVPSSKIRSLFAHQKRGTRKGIRYSRIKKTGKKYLEAWSVLK